MVFMSIRQQTKTKKERSNEHTSGEINQMALTVKKLRLTKNAYHVERQPKNARYLAK